MIDARLPIPIGDGYGFRRTLIRDAVHHDLLPGERIRLHTRRARAPTAGPAPAPEGRAAAEPAAHRYAAGDRPRAFATAWRAAGAAYAYAERPAMPERVQDLWDAVPAPVGDPGARTRRRHGRPRRRRAETLLTEALHLPDPARDPAREHTGGTRSPTWSARWAQPPPTKRSPRRYAHRPPEPKSTPPWPNSAHPPPSCPPQATSSSAPTDIRARGRSAHTP
ncbi:hypothetical protein [Embleya hyalina]|uniref:Helix-turn-helix transcriptional regulator n=1 Tax=Embleya hyalina TaxID=516124 RepID=A0A401YJF5_9ACTN|nr:hypothetical protein [Embleya hyalina]GCD94736.1 helix-turn-helix transcriptional regulator [Embleya hyalina]